MTPLDKFREQVAIALQQQSERDKTHYVTMTAFEAAELLQAIADESEAQFESGKYFGRRM